jgi:CYTH domain-containing protein
MALEIERRFLVCGEAWRPLVRWTRALQQGYLAGSADGLTLRVRSDGGDGAWLTLKYPAAGIARQEFEYAIPPADAEALLERSGSRVCKARHGLALPGGDWVLDVFSGDNAPLVIAEVELEQAGDHQPGAVQQRRFGSAPLRELDVRRATALAGSPATQRWGSSWGRLQQLKPSRQILPWSMAQFSSATRFLAPVLVNTLLTWLSTVRLLIISRSPISWLVSPWATNSMISSSRSESSMR